MSDIDTDCCEPARDVERDSPGNEACLTTGRVQAAGAAADGAGAALGPAVCAAALAAAASCAAELSMLRLDAAREGARLRAVSCAWERVAVTLPHTTWRVPLQGWLRTALIR